VADVAIVGGGVGGLCAAIRLRAAGHQVDVFERNAVMGGKVAVRERDGFTFDIGPSLLTLPKEFDDVLRLAGTTLAEQVDLVRLDPQFRYQWSDGSTLEIPNNPGEAQAAVEAFSPGSGADWRLFMARAHRVWNVSERTFFAGPMTSPLSLLRRMNAPSDFTAIDAMRTLHKAALDTFRDPRLQQWAGRYATYSGSSPFRAPATLACIPAIEQRYGAWYITGGLGRLRDALVRACESFGVGFHASTEVSEVTNVGGRVTGVRTAEGNNHAASVVIANVDAEHLYRDLLPQPSSLRRLKKATPSGSGYVVMAGVKGATPNVAHHSIWFSPSYTEEYADLDAGRPARKPTVYACVSSASDSSQALDGCENWFLLANAPADGGSMDGYADVMLDRLAACGTDLRGRLLFTETMSPADIASRYRAGHGSIYGTSSNGKRAAFARPANRGPVKGLYLVGGTSHPGGGLPLVAMSARIVADMIAADQ
jgi:phytoene desaturase